ncbi:MAG: O-antigen ligase family protein [Labilithrix sp.]|nr:O-antigen ligase family protein [Labilithrix sp.]
MSFFATFVLVFVLVVRPQEVWPFLAAFRLLDVFTGLAVVGLVVDWINDKRSALSPQLPYVAALVVWGYLATVGGLGRDGLVLATQRVLIPAIFMLAVAFSVRSFGQLKWLMGLLLALAAFVSVVAIHQGQIEPECIELAPELDDLPDSMPDLGDPDGRSCDTAYSCTKGGRAGADYVCERLGLFNTVSTQRRVRWRGQLGDPNELSIYVAAVMPLLFAVGAGAKRRLASVASLALVVVGLYAVILTQSRGGQLVVAAVFGIYFVARLGPRGLVAGMMLALPVLLFGGRDDAMADASAGERTELLYDGVSMFMQHPLLGVGIDQFREHTSIRLTAHNAYLLAAAELGGIGIFVWTSLYWMSMKIPLTILRTPPAALDPRLREAAKALLVSFVGMAIGVFFLSFTYKQLLFVWFGMAGALYSVVKRQHPEFQVRMGRDWVGVILADAAILLLVFVYSRLKA